MIFLARNRVQQSLKSISFTQLLLELVVVFFGVYLAFLLSNHQVNRQHSQKSLRAVELVKFGVHHYKGLFSGFALQHEAENREFRASLERGEVPFFGGSIYAAPQYPVGTINILTNESYDLFTLDLYVPLIEYQSAIQRIMYVEEKLVGLSEKYEPLPEETDPEYERVFKQQHHHAVLYLKYSEMRKSISQDLARRSGELAEKLEKLGLS